MRGGVDELRRQMEKAAQKYINTPKLQEILKWADQATSGSEGNFKPVAKRAAAIAYAYAYAIYLAKEFEKIKIFKTVNFTVLIARLESLKVQVPDNQQPLEVRRKFVDRIQQILLKALNLSPELVHLSEEEAEAIGNYLDANLLMVQCKQAAVRVSPKTWEAIEDRMLLVPGD